MTAARRAWLLAASLGALVAGLAPASTAASTQPLPAAAHELAAVPNLASNFRSCVAGSGTADIVLLMDESGSLQESDPEDVRVKAAALLINRWGKEAERPSADINVKLMGFSDDASAYSGWLSAKSSLADIRKGVAAFAARDGGSQTDYLMGLDGARRELAARAATRPDSCQAIVWLSDGKLDAFSRYRVDGQSALKPYLKKDVSNAQATKAAALDLCRPGGVADQIRSAEVSLLAIGLTSADAPAATFDLMRSVAVGDDGPVPCGTVSAKGLGSFQLANNLDDLFFIFRGLGRTSGDVAEQQTKICQGALSPACAHAFVLDDSIAGVDILARAGAEGLQMWITPPAGKPAQVKPTSKVTELAVGGASIRVKAESALTTSLLMTRKAAWKGPWTVQYLDPDKATAEAMSRSSIELTADVRPTVQLPEEPLRTGAKSPPLQIGLVRADGTAIAPSELLGTVIVVATVVDGAGATVLKTPEINAAGLATPLVVDLTNAEPGAGRIELRLLLKTADFIRPKAKPLTGTTLAPVEVSLPMPLDPPLGYPIAPAEADFGSFVGPVNATVKLPLGGEGCVWIDSATFATTAQPADADAVSVSSPHNSAQSCLAVPPGSTTGFPLTLTSAEGVGGLVGTVQMQLAPKDNPGKARVLRLKVSADLDRKPQLVVAWAAFIAALALALAIPVGLLYLMKWRAGVIPGRALVGGLFPITVQDGQVLRDGAPFALHPSDLRDSIVIPAKGTRRLSVGAASLTAKQGWSPLGTGRVDAVVPGAVGVSDVAPAPHSSGRAELPLALHNHWALFRSPTGSPHDAQLLLLMGGERTRADIAREVEETLAGIPDVMEKLGPLPGQDAGDDGATGLGLADPDEDLYAMGATDFWSDPDGGFAVEGQPVGAADRSSSSSAGSPSLNTPSAEGPRGPSVRGGTSVPDGDSAPDEHDYSSFWDDDTEPPKT